jgi:4-hydroxy-tetrahydrodipicolinate synthase
LFRGAFLETNPIPIKAMMEACGMAAGPCRLPLCELLPENLQKVQELVKEYELVRM